MSIKELQQQTTVNVQEKANLIWAIADNMRQAYHDFTDGMVTQTAADGTEIRVESKVRENDYFKYSKLFIMNPERDAEGNIVRSLEQQESELMEKLLH